MAEAEYNSAEHIAKATKLGFVFKIRFNYEKEVLHSAVRNNTTVKWFKVESSCNSNSYSSGFSLIKRFYTHYMSTSKTGKYNCLCSNEEERDMGTLSTDPAREHFLSKGAWKQSVLPLIPAAVCKEWDFTLRDSLQDGSYLLKGWKGNVPISK